VSTTNEDRVDNSHKVASIYALAWIGSTSRMLGDFFRELAVLFLVFVPLEWWKPNVNVGNPNFLWHVGEVTIVLLLAGLVAEYVSLGACRAKRDLEGNHGSE